MWKLLAVLFVSITAGVGVNLIAELTPYLLKQPNLNYTVCILISAGLAGFCIVKCLTS